jgi:hypothetical protein
MTDNRDIHHIAETIIKKMPKATNEERAAELERYLADKPELQRAINLWFAAEMRAARENPQ